MPNLLKIIAASASGKTGMGKEKIMSFIESMFDIQGRVAAITGGAGILGGEMARGLRQAGAQIVLLDIAKSKIDERIAREFPGDKGVSGYECNALDQGSLEKVRDEILAANKRIDILINAAGGNMPGSTIPDDKTIFDLTPEGFKGAVDLNLFGTVLPSIVFGRPMADRKKGSIINISSMAATRMLTRVVAYSAAKAAIDNFTKWLAMELAQKFGEGLRVNAIAPGFFITEQNRSLLTNQDGSYTERGHKVIRQTPFGRFGTPQELVGTILWLASDASAFVTGTVTPIDGGFSIFSGV
jgi:NAD(P)-dependent dehydrogenase (short-subunit alcohol dehydrogenase family)